MLLHSYSLHLCFEKCNPESQSLFLYAFPFFFCLCSTQCVFCPDEVLIHTLQNVGANLSVLLALVLPFYSESIHRLHTDTTAYLYDFFASINQMRNAKINYLTLD